MTEINELEIIQLDFNSTYQLFKQLELDENKPENYNKLYQMIRYGIKIEFDIYSLLDNEFTPKPKTNEIIIEGKTYTKQEFNTEIENREALMKKTIIDSQKDESPYKTRE